MKIHGSVFGDLAGVPERARHAEAAGYDGVVAAEISNDPFLPMALAAEHTERIELVTAIAVAFSRNPMTVAQLGHDLNAYSKGRFVLGLGSQIKPHITKRFSMPWSKPAARMREFVLALRAIWDTWHTGAPLEFRGEFYSHTLMTPMFVPSMIEFGAPRVIVAGVGNLMTETAGEVADGLLAHAFTTPRYMREVTLPALERGLARAGRKREDFEVMCPAFVASGETDEAFEGSRNALRQQIAFYASTPAYRPVLELHGWEFGPELTALSKQGKWVEMGQRITDDVLETFAVVAEPKDVGAEIARRYGDMLDTWVATFQPTNADTRSAMFAATRT